MKLSKLEITNFRCFESLTVDLDEKLMVLVGDNGSGKTAILDAIAIGLAPIARRFKQSPGEDKLTLLDITEIPKPPSDGLRVFEDTPPKPFCALRFSGHHNNQNIEWDAHLLRDKSKRTKSSLPHMVANRRLHEALDKDVFAVAENPAGGSGSLPVFAYYGTSRAALEIPRRHRDFQTAFSREAALKLALNPVSRFKDAFEWFFAMERDELALRNQKEDFRYKMPVLETVRQAIAKMLPEFTNPRITTHPLHFVLSRKEPDGNVTDLFAEQLSDGYRTMLALVMDFARRLAQANPQHPAPLDSEAILIIDEVDLHLHPDWQQTIVPDLQRTFPNTQFILTTHSPQVLTSLHSRNVRVLRDRKLQPSPGGIFGAESKRTLERVFQVPSRPPADQVEPVRDLNRLFDLINEEKFPEAKELAQKLAADFQGNDPVVDEALTIIENRLWEKEEGL